MRSTTTLGCSRISQFGKRRTVQPRSFSQWSRATSRAGVGKWGAPSASRTIAASTQKKSTMNRPSGCCLRNFTPQSARSRSSFHRARSAGVAARRSARERCVVSRSSRGMSFYRREPRRSCVKSVLPSPFGKGPGVRGRRVARMLLLARTESTAGRTTRCWSRIAFSSSVSPRCIDISPRASPGQQICWFHDVFPWSLPANRRRANRRRFRHRAVDFLLPTSQCLPARAVAGRSKFQESYATANDWDRLGARSYPYAQRMRAES